MKELEISTLEHLNGGESIWYWVSYAAGSTARWISEIEIPEGQYEWSPARPYG